MNDLVHDSAEMDSEAALKNINNMEEDFVSPGVLLQKARAAKHLSQEQVAENLLLSKKIIVELEQDDYARIAAPVYARGYLRSYAQFLGADEENLLKAFERLQPKIGSSLKHKKIDYKIESVPKQYSQVRWIGYLFFVLLVVLVFGWVVSHHHLPKHENLPAVGGISSFVPIASQIKPAVKPVQAETKQPVANDVSQEDAGAVTPSMGADKAAAVLKSDDWTGQ